MSCAPLWRSVSESSASFFSYIACGSPCFARRYATRAVPYQGATQGYCQPSCPAMACSTSQARHPTVLPLFVAASITANRSGQKIAASCFAYSHGRV